MDAVFQQLSRAYADRLDALGCQQCATAPAPAAWSTQGVVEHLVLTFRSTAEQCRKYRERGKVTTRKARLSQLAARFVIIGLNHFPRGIAAPEFVLPGRGGFSPMNGNALAALFNHELAALDHELARGEHLFGRRPLAAHFRLGPLTAQQWRRFHVVHGRHHLAQLDRIHRSLPG